MKTIKEKTNILVDKLGMKRSPVAVTFTQEKPPEALGFKKSGHGCIAPLIFSAAKGKTIAFDKDTTGYACSAFYLGYNDWIFNGIEYFLSTTPNRMFGERECEQFLKSPEQAKEYLDSVTPKEMRKGAIVFKPFDKLLEDEVPEVVIFFVNPDQLSALVSLIHYNHPLDSNRVVTGFASSCASVVTFPLQFAASGQMKAFQGYFDPAARHSVPENILSLSMPFKMYEEICGYIEDSFLFTERWQQVLSRINKASAISNAL
jgi:uncharacterized protein (DUF169 family)